MIVDTSASIELSIVVERQLGLLGSRQCDAFLRNAEILIEPFTAEQAQIARQAYLDFGKGHHPAAFNLGDCFAMPWQKSTRENSSLQR